MKVLSANAVTFTVVVAALGYFVDIYDLLLVVRRSSLLGIGVPAEQLLEKGVLLFNMQMAGMLIGGIAWGVLGDKRGRLSVLFGSIILYSLANIANGLVHGVGSYAVVRFIAGFGLAGELGAGITLVSELMSPKSRGYGTAIVAAVGICGAVVGALVGDLVPWRTAYFVGGGLGLALLVLRFGVMESGMFRDARNRGARRGNLAPCCGRRAACGATSASSPWGYRYGSWSACWSGWPPSCGEGAPAARSSADSVRRGRGLLPSPDGPPPQGDPRCLPAVASIKAASGAGRPPTPHPERQPSSPRPRRK